MKCVRVLFSLTLVANAAVLVAADAAPAEPKVTFDEHIKPIFRAKCANCHNTDKKVAGLDLTNYTSMMQGGGSGAAVEPGDASVSYLWMVVAHETEPYMPPNSPKMDDASLAVIKEWIDLGAPENKGSKVAAKKSMDLSLSGVPTGKPEGPPPMPPHLPLEPIKYTERANATTALASSPWAPVVAVGGYQQVLLYNSRTLELIGILPYPEGVPKVLKFSRNGKLLLAGGGRGAYQGVCAVWDITTGERITTIGDETDEILAADISPDQQMVALGGSNRKVKVYSTQSGELIYEIKKHTEWVYALEFSPDNVLLATADRNGGLIVWEALTGNEFLVLDGHKTAVNAVSWRPDSNLLASCDDDGQVRLWEMENGKSVKNWGAHGGGTKSVEFTRDGRLVTAGVDRTVKLWKADGSQEKAFAAFGDIALDATFAAEGDRVIGGDWTGEIRVWNPADGAQVGALAPNPPTLQMRIDQATAALGAVKPKHEAAAAAVVAMETGVQGKAAELDKLKADIVTAEAAKKAADEKAKPLSDRVAVLKTAQANAASAAKQTAQVVASLQAAIEQAKTAAKTDGGAADLAIAVSGLEAALTARTSQVATQTQAVEHASQQLAPLMKELEAVQAAIASADKATADLEVRVAAGEMDLKAKQEQLAAGQKAMSETQAALASAEAEVKRWQDELAFAKKGDNAQASVTP